MGEDNSATIMASKAKDKPVIGLIGGIGAGKSTVAAELAALGCAVLDGDEIGHELLTDESVKRQVRERWGDGVFDADGDVRRSALGDIVFADADELAALNAILHPRIGQELKRRIGETRARRDVEAVVVDAAVLVEAGWQELCTTVVFVDAPRSARLDRVRTQRNWDDAELAARENMQFALDKKRAMADHVLSNLASDPSFAQDVRELLSRITHTDNH